MTRRVCRDGAVVTCRTFPRRETHSLGVAQGVPDLAGKRSPRKRDCGHDFGHMPAPYRIQCDAVMRSGQTAGTSKRPSVLGAIWRVRRVCFPGPQKQTALPGNPLGTWLNSALRRRHQGEVEAPRSHTCRFPEHHRPAVVLGILCDKVTSRTRSSRVTY